MHRSNIYSEVNKYLITLWFCKFSYLEIMEGSTIFSIGAFPLWETESKNKNPEITLYDFLTIYLWITVSNFLSNLFTFSDSLQVLKSQ